MKNNNVSSIPLSANNGSLKYTKSCSLSNEVKNQIRKIVYKYPWDESKLLFRKELDTLMELQRTQLIDEIVGLVDACRWVSGTHFVINGKQEKMISKPELKTKLIELKEKV